MIPYWICCAIGAAFIVLSWLEVMPPTAGWVGFGIALGSSLLSLSPRLLGNFNTTIGDTKVYERQWDETGRQQRVAEKQLEETEREQQIAQKQLEEAERQQKESQHIFEISGRQLEQKQSQLDVSAQLIALEESNARKVAQLVDTYADLAGGLNAVLSKLERQGDA